MVNWQRHAPQLLNAIPLLPQEPLISLCHLLENEPINDALFDVLEQRLSPQLDAAIDYLQRKIEEEPIPELVPQPFPGHGLPADDVSD